MTKPTPKRKPFRRECWAVVWDSGLPTLCDTRREAVGLLASAHIWEPGRIARVLITELPRKGRDGKR